MNPTILGLQAQGFFIRFLHQEGSCRSPEPTRDLQLRGASLLELADGS